jgi:ABC-type multidrug transport system ATPase subunit
VNIELTDVTRSFGESKAVDGVSLQAGPGVLGLLGPNGAGKTSLLRMLATVLPPVAWPCGPRSTTTGGPAPATRPMRCR